MIDRAASQDLPLLLCHRAVLGELTADLDSEPWKHLPRAELRDTITGETPKQSTQFSAAWTPQELRVVFEAIDSEPWATLIERDAALYTEEVFEVFLDPFGDLETYFEIEVNPLDTVLDLVLRRTRSGYRKDFAWDCEGLHTKVRRTANGWAAELSIPFASLSGEVPRAGTRWRANFFRIDRPSGRDRELSAWSPSHAGTFHIPQRFGTVEFVE